MTNRKAKTRGCPLVGGCSIVHRLQVRRRDKIKSYSLHQIHFPKILSVYRPDVSSSISLQFGFNWLLHPDWQQSSVSDLFHAVIPVSYRSRPGCGRWGSWVQVLSGMEPEWRPVLCRCTDPDSAHTAATESESDDFINSGHSGINISVSMTSHNIKAYSNLLWLRAPEFNLQGGL